MNPVIKHMQVFCSIKSEVPGDGLPNLHVSHDAVGNREIDSVRPVRLLDRVPPLLSFRVNPAPLRVGGSP